MTLSRYVIEDGQLYKRPEPEFLTLLTHMAFAAKTPSHDEVALYEKFLAAPRSRRREVLSVRC